MMRFLFVFGTFALLLATISCGGGDDDASSSTQTPVASPASTGGELENKLASVLLQATDVPAGLQASGLNFSYNADVAASQEDLDRLNTLGRLVGVDLTFVPTQDIPENEVVRGGIQNSASVYTNNDGASQTFHETQDSVRQTDWQQSYPDLADFSVHEVEKTVGDESIWLRISGTETCAVQTPAGAPPTEAPTVTCSTPRKVVDDYVIFRAGRVRALIKVLSAHPVDSAADVFEDQMQAWAQIVVERADEVFPPVP